VARISWRDNAESEAASRCILFWYRPGNRTDSRAGQNLYFCQDSPCEYIYHLTVEIPKEIFIDDYPEKIETLGDLLRKTRLDQGLEIKELQKSIGAFEGSIVNWECQGTQPKIKYLRPIVEFIDTHQPEPIPRKKIWGLCFSENPTYPSDPKSFGEKLRATRMQNFMTIKDLAQKLGVNECTVARWESKGSHPNPDKLERVEAFLTAHCSEALVKKSPIF